MPGKFIISLYFELLWGGRDHANRASYSTNIMGAREAIPPVRELFDTHSIAATWATVGFAMCGSRDELMESLPPRDLWPSYDAGRLSSYAYLDDVGRDERQDPELPKRYRASAKAIFSSEAVTEAYQGIYASIFHVEDSQCAE